MKRFSLLPGAVLLALAALGVSPSSAFTAADHAASEVWGQPNLTSDHCKPILVSLCAPAQSTIDAQGNLWVADFDNNRVLMFPPGSAGASKVFGQYGSFITHGCDRPAPPGSHYPAAPNQYTLCEPVGVAVDRQGTLYIGDAINNRVLIYFHAADKPADAPADLVLGQSNFHSTSSNDVHAGGRGALACPAPAPASRCTLNSPMDLSIDAQGDLLVADLDNHRVLLWKRSTLERVGPGACARSCFIPAAEVWGQYGSFATNVRNNPVIPSGASARCTVITFLTPDSACTLSGPWAAVADAQGNIYVADTSNNRVLEYDAGLETGRQDATRVYGQDGNFRSARFNLGGVSASSLWHPLGMALDPNDQLWVADFHNERVLGFPTLSNASPTTAVHVLGQDDRFSTSVCAVNADSLCGPTSIAFDQAGHAFVSDGLNSRVLEYLNPR